MTAPSDAAGDADTASVTAMISDPARAGMLVALADGQAQPASALARAAGITPSTASAHLARLLGTGLLQVEAYGRHRYYRLAGAEVVALVEQLAVGAPRRLVRSPHGSRAADGLALARSCYDHPAGALGVAITDRLVGAGLLQPAPGPAYVVDPEHGDVLAPLGVDVGAVVSGRRTAARPCLDWTERRHHVAGALGAAVLDRLLRAGWLRRVDGSRALAITDLGRSCLRQSYGIEPEGATGPTT